MVPEHPKFLKKSTGPRGRVAFSRNPQTRRHRNHPGPGYRSRLRLQNGPLDRSAVLFVCLRAERQNRRACNMAGSQGEMLALTVGGR